MCFIVGNGIMMCVCVEVMLSLSQGIVYSVILTRAVEVVLVAAFNDANCHLMSSW